MGKGLPYDAVEEACANALPGEGHKALLSILSKIVPDHEVKLGLVRGGWYRLGGVVTDKGEPVAENLRDWVEKECGGVIEDLIALHGDSGYLTTKLVGKSLYVVVPMGEGPLDFIQIEVEEIEELAENHLVNPEYIPDDLEDMLDLQNVSLLGEPLSISPPRYHLRRLTDFREGLDGGGPDAITDKRFLQFVEEWQSSSAAQENRFCDHWVLTLMPYTDRFGERRFDVKPRPIFQDKSPAIEALGVGRGMELGKVIHQFDRDHGYPMAWYFAMVTNGGVPHKVAYAVLDDLNGAYAYLPAKDLKILQNWAVDPFSL